MIRNENVRTNSEKSIICLPIKGSDSNETGRELHMGCPFSSYATICCLSSNDNGIDQ